MSSNNVLESLSPLEAKIVPYLKLPISEVQEKSGLDTTSVQKGLKLLESKDLLTLQIAKSKIIELGTNGIHYKKNHLPERVLLNTLDNQNHLSLDEAKKLSKLSDNEFKVSLGLLKKKDLISLKDGKISLTGSKEQIIQKWPEEQLLESLPLLESEVPENLQQVLQVLLKRKDILVLENKSEISFTLTSKGKQIAGQKPSNDLVEEVTPSLIANWKPGKRFRRYDINAPVPKLIPGKRHFVSQAIDYGKKIWTDLGFKEMTGTLTQTSFWNFDALFTAQDHPVREMQDTFFIKDVSGKLPDKKILDKVKKTHELGIAGSKGWQYSWDEKLANQVVLRTHTTCLSAQTLASMKKSEMPAKFFALGRNFRNETVDWSHGFEFNQTEGIVVDKNANFSNLLGYLKEFFSKMGFEKIRFTPAYFPYTEPSVEIHWYHPEKKVWLEFGGAGIFRPEITVPLLGEQIPVLAWGPGFDRIMMDYYKIKDLRTVYSNELNDLRTKRPWIK